MMEYVSIRLSTLRANAALNFDLYVYFKETHLKYKSSKEILSTDLLKKFKDKKVKKLFIPEDQESAYLEYLDNALDALEIKTEKIENRAALAQDSLRQTADNIEKTLDSEENYKASENRIQKVIEFMISEPTALVHMLTDAGLSVDQSTHGPNVSTLALGIGTASKQFDRAALTDLAIAGLLHDSNLEKLGFTHSQSLDDITKEKKSDYKKHPQKAIEEIAGKKFITARVLRIIEDHEEYGDGKGFPNKKRIEKLNLDSQVFNLCDKFEHHTIRKNSTARDSLDSFIETYSEDFPFEWIEMLEKLVKG